MPADAYPSRRDPLPQVASTRNTETTLRAGCTDDVLLDHMLPRLSVSVWFVLSRVDRRTRSLVGRGMQEGEGLRPRASDFVNSIARLGSAWLNGCRWDALCKKIPSGGNVDVLRWALEQDPPCPLDEGTYASAAVGGHLDVLMLAHEHLPVGGARCICRRGRTPGRAEVGAGARLPLRRMDVYRCRYGRRSGRANVGAEAPLPVEPPELYLRGTKRPLRDNAVHWVQEHGCPEVKRSAWTGKKMIFGKAQSSARRNG